MSSQRLFAAGPIAGLATAGLFLTMNGLLADSGEVLLDERPPLRIVEYVQDETPPLDPQKKWEVIEPEEVKLPPVEDIPETSCDCEDVPTVGPIAPEPPTLSESGPTFGGLADGAQLPLVRVQPQYPRRAMERGIEGYVVVSLTVAPDGTVPFDSILIADEEPVGVFDKAAKKAASKFKYKPKVVDGVAQAVSGVQYRFTFEFKQ